MAKRTSELEPEFCLYSLYDENTKTFIRKNSWLGFATDQINAALAHDLLEDTETSFLEIKAVANSTNCAELCAELRNNKFGIAEQGKEDYMTEKLLKMSNDALLIKLAYSKFL